MDIRENERPSPDRDEACCWLCEGTGLIEADEGGDEEKAVCPACGGTGKGKRSSRPFRGRSHGATSLRMGVRVPPRRFGRGGGGRPGPPRVLLPRSVVPSDALDHPLRAYDEVAMESVIEEAPGGEGTPLDPEAVVEPLDDTAALDTAAGLQVTPAAHEQSGEITPAFDLGGGFGETPNLLCPLEAETDPPFGVAWDSSTDIQPLALEPYPFPDSLSPSIDYDIGALNKEPEDPLGPSGSPDGGCV